MVNDGESKNEEMVKVVNDGENGECIDVKRCPCGKKAIVFEIVLPGKSFAVTKVTVTGRLPSSFFSDIPKTGVAVCMLLLFVLLLMLLLFVLLLLVFLLLVFFVIGNLLILASL